MKNVRKWMKRKLGDVCYICNFVSYDYILDCKLQMFHNDPSNNWKL